MKNYPTRYSDEQIALTAGLIKAGFPKDQIAEIAEVSYQTVLNVSKGRSKRYAIAMGIIKDESIPKNCEWICQPCASKARKFKISRSIWHRHVCDLCGRGGLVTSIHEGKIS